MKIIKNSITSLAGRGYISLQIPMYAIASEEEINTVRNEEVPDEWITKIKNYCPVVGKEQGFQYLTKAGWKANKDKIKEAYANAEFPRGPWVKFEQYVVDHFKKVEGAKKRRIRLLEKKLKDLKNTIV